MKKIQSRKVDMKTDGVRHCVAVVTTKDKQTTIRQLNLEGQAVFSLDEMAMWLKEADPTIDTVRFTSSSSRKR